MLWDENGKDIKAKIIYELGDHPTRYVANEGMYFRRGIAGGKRGEFFDVHTLPAGMIFSNEGRAFQAEENHDLGYLLAYLNHPICQNLVNVFCGQHKGAGYLRRIPIPHKIIQEKALLTTTVLELANTKRSWASMEEFGLDFLHPGSRFLSLGDHDLVSTSTILHANASSAVKDYESSEHN